MWDRDTGLCRQGKYPSRWWVAEKSFKRSARQEQPGDLRVLWPKASARGHHQRKGLCGSSSHIQPKTSVKDFRFHLPEAAEFDSGQNGIVRMD